MEEKEMIEFKEWKKAGIYVSTYCNFAHRRKDGKPLKHECRTIPPLALWQERQGDYEAAIETMKGKR